MHINIEISRPEGNASCTPQRLEQQTSTGQLARTPNWGFGLRAKGPKLTKMDEVLVHPGCQPRWSQLGHIRTAADMGQLPAVEGPPWLAAEVFQT